jgi:hypothetical protein
VFSFHLLIQNGCVNLLQKAKPPPPCLQMEAGGAEEEEEEEPSMACLPASHTLPSVVGSEVESLAVSILCYHLFIFL